MPVNIPSAGRDRLTALVRSEVSDRIPIAFWRHFYDDENDPVSLSDAMVRFQREYGWDWIKLNPRACYHLEDWGYLYEPSTDVMRKPVPKYFPVQSPEDWRKIEPRDPNAGVLAEHLEAVRLTVAGARGVPVLMTVFTPLSVAGDLVPDDGLLVQHLREHPDLVEPALEAITQTFESYVTELLNAGADGLFFATTQWASRRLLRWEEYQRWGTPYDLRILGAVAEAPFNLLHVCNADAYLAELRDYPVHLFNWGFADDGNPGLAEGQKILNRPVIGGVARQSDLRDGTPATITDTLARVREEMGTRPWGCGPDCSIHADSRPENLRAVVSALTPSSSANR